MEGVAINSNQFLASSRLFSNSYFSSLLKQQIDSQLVAFCTLLTVALSVLLLSFHKQSRTHLNFLATPSKCIGCCLKQINRSSKKLNKLSNYIPRNVAITSNINITNKIKYLKLKRLRNIASASLSLTKFTCTNYLIMPLNSTFTKMKKNTTNQFKKAYNFRLSRKVDSSTNARHFCSECEVVEYENHSTSLPALQNYSQSRENEENNNNNTTLNNSNNLNTLRKSKTSPRLVNSRVRLYKKLPLRTMSRAWGEINSIDLPVWCRKPCFYFYSWVFKCNLDEIDIEDLNEYKNLSEFFRRGLKPDARVIDQSSCLISPCDGKILHFGVCEKGYLEQVKGVNYSLKAFLGEQNWPKSEQVTDPRSQVSIEQLDQDHELYEKSILYNPDNCLYHCIIYLAPGDYHRFHTPADWEIYFRRHFPGELFSVNPSVARWLQGLFNLNERVVYYGKWKYGFFSMAAVGATNVGSIRVYADEGLSTNNKSSSTFELDLDKSFCQTTFSNQGELKGVQVKRGDLFGEFNLGSTIVLIFEAPKNFDFNVKQNDKIFFGSPLGSCASSTRL